MSPARCGKRIAIDGGFLFRDPANPELWCSVLYVAESDNFLILRGARWVDVPALFPDLTSEPTPGDVAFVPDPASPTEPR